MKKIIQKITNKLGYDIFRSDARFHPVITIIELAKKTKCNWIIDVGANVGQYGLALREFDYAGNILSFEPLSDAHQKLVAVASHDSNWIVAKRCALGSANGTSKINVSLNSVSSSLLDMGDLHKIEAPNSKYIKTEEIEVATLDGVINDYLKSEDLIALKIDTQGYEKEVVTGALKSMERCMAIQLELNVKPMYQSDFLFEDALKLMKTLGFELYSISPGFSNSKTGQTFQLDGTFLRSSL